jgi:hypothetical protein
LYWNSSNAYSATIDNGVGTVNVNGSRTAYDIYGTRTYTMTVYGQYGTAQCSTTVYTNNLPPPPYYETPSCTLTVSPNGVAQGQPATIRWNSQNAASIWIDNGIGDVNQSGVRTIYPTRTTVITGHAIGRNGQQVVCNASVGVYVPPMPPVQPPVYHPPYVSLTQVPYTGFGDIDVLMAIYLGAALVCLSTGIYAVRGGHVSSALRAFTWA